LFEITGDGATSPERLSIGQGHEPRVHPFSFAEMEEFQEDVEIRYESVCWSPHLPFSGQEFMKVQSVTQLGGTG
jgi:hypothetical protein